MRHITLFIILLSSLSCERITSKDGSIPPEYLSIAQKYEGDYEGVFGNKPGVLSIKIIGNKPELSFVSDNGESDLLPSSCQSKLGHLAAIDPQKFDHELRVDTAEFLINGGKCKLIENYLLLDFKHQQNIVSRIDLSLFEKYEIEMRTICYPDGSGRQHCQSQSQSVPSYILGSFQRR